MKISKHQNDVQKVANVIDINLDDELYMNLYKDRYI